MDADGNNQQRITNNPADDWPAAWSPDGQWLVFASERDGNWNLYVVEAAGGPAQPLTDAPGDERDPIWSPDGQSIAFAYNQGAGWDIYTLPVATTDIRVVSSSEWSQITNTPGDERYPVWSQ
jgi:Tol biopolymer transport system component